jgi:hypothetical protein
VELRFFTARATKDIDLTCLRRIDASEVAIEHVIVRELQKLVKVDLQGAISSILNPVSIHSVFGRPLYVGMIAVISGADMPIVVLLSQFFVHKCKNCSFDFFTLSGRVVLSSNFSYDADNRTTEGKLALSVC